MIQVQNLTLSFGDQKIFDHISCIIQTHQRIGLVGVNGTGKSTLLKVITQQHYVDGGTVAISKQCTVAYMPQEVVLVSEKTVFQEALSTHEELYQALQESALLEKSLAAGATEADLDAYAQAQQHIADLNVELVKQEVAAVLTGLGFSAVQQESAVNTLSVGWKMRLVLAKLLLKKADFYLFDEPTNHLDIVAKDWFLQFLKNSRCGFLLVCHERYFLDTLCTDILELERGTATWYKGNYQAYQQQKEFNRAALERAYEQQQREIAKKIETIERFRASATKAKMAQSMMKELEKIERITLPPSSKNIAISIRPPVRPGKIVLSAHNVSFSFGTKKIFSQVSFDIERGQRVALIAPNGTGKTTLFNLVAKLYPLQQGTITYGHNVEYALFAQDQNAVLPPEKTIFEHVVAACPKKTEAEIRGLLGAFLFSNDMINKKLGVLSGGEKNRVSMISTLFQNANVLLLDEPTNHLDIPSKEILLKALLGFEGTIFFVSHDHDFINRLATRILELTPNGIESYEGNYNDYRYQKAARTNSATQAATSLPARTAATTPQPSASDGKQVFELRKQLKKTEHAIEVLERSIEQSEQKFGALDYGSPAFAQEEKKLVQIRSQLTDALQEWEMLLNKIDNLSQ